MIHIPSWATNPLFGGGLALMLSGFVLALARNVPLQIFGWFKRQFTVSVEVLNSDPCFHWLTVWLNEHPYTKKARRLAVSTPKHFHKGDEDSDENKNVPRIIFSPSPGNHFLRYKGKLIWLSRIRKEATPGNTNGFFSMERPEEYVLTMLGRSQDVARELIEDAYALTLHQQKCGAAVYVHTYSYWSKLKGFEPRPMASVILPGTMAEEILADVQEFLASRSWYQDRGIPYRRGYLFFGIPGSGKTSFIMGLSDELKLNIYVLNLGSKMLSDDVLPGLMLDIPPQSIVLMEDIDAVVPDRERETPAVKSKSQPGLPPTNGDAKETEAEKEKGVSLSCLLNCLDGVVAGNGSMVFMTSNHPERLDPALIRPGRVDVRREYGHVVPEQAERLFRRFYRGASLVLEAELGDAVRDKNLTMADLQRVFLEHKTDPVTAVAEVKSIPAGKS